MVENNTCLRRLFKHIAIYIVYHDIAKKHRNIRYCPALGRNGDYSAANPITHHCLSCMLKLWTAGLRHILTVGSLLALC